MNEDFLKLLDRIRADAGIPFIINSGYRTQAHNTAIGGTPNSAHLRGLAVDIRAVGGKAKFIIVSTALKHGINRIGIGSTFIHLDADQSLPTPSIWTYND